VLLLRPWPSKVGIHAHVLLELLESIVGTLAHAIEPTSVHVAVRDVAIGEEGCRGDRVVGREPMERIRQHCVVYV